MPPAHRKRLKLQCFNPASCTLQPEAVVKAERTGRTIIRVPRSEEILKSCKGSLKASQGFYAHIEVIFLLYFFGGKMVVPLFANFLRFDF